MSKDGYAFLAILLVIFLLPASSDALIEEKSSIVGTLCGASNKPLSGVTIRLLDSFFLAEVAKTATDESGKFTIANLLPGLYLVSVEIPSLNGLLKRVQVVSGSPTFIDLRSVLTEEQLKDHDAWEKFKWTIRVAERNPLREEELPSEDAAKYHYDSDSFLAFLKTLRESNNIKGEVSYVSVGGGPWDESWTHQMTQFMVQGDLEDEGSWSINGNFLDGRRMNYMGSGDFRYHLSDHSIGATLAANDLVFARYPSLQRQMIRRFSQAPGEEDLAENKLWIASVDLNDQWQPFQRLRFDYATRIDYYGYLSDSVGYSPRVGVSYQLTPSVFLQGRYYRNQSAPGNYYLQPEDVHPYIHDVAFIPYADSLRAEQTVGYEAGLDFSAEAFQLSVFYYDESVSDKIATVDLSDSPVTEQLQSFRPFVIFNAGDLQSRGAAIQIRRQISTLLSAVGSYSMALSIPVFIIEKNTYPNRQLFFRNGTNAEDFHDVAAGIEANIEHTQTQVRADWRWTSGTPLIFGRAEEAGSLSSIDVEVHQGIPVHIFSQSELKLLVAVRNVLDQEPITDTNADFHRSLVYSMPRVVAGGLLLKF